MKSETSVVFNRYLEFEEGPHHWSMDIAEADTSFNKAAADDQPPEAVSL